MSKEIFLIPKIKPQNVKNASQFLKNTTLGIFMVKWISNDNLNPAFTEIVLPN